MIDVYRNITDISGFWVYYRIPFFQFSMMKALSKEYHAMSHYITLLPLPYTVAVSILLEYEEQSS
jgi:hypothetical protein